MCTVDGLCLLLSFSCNNIIWLACKFKIILAIQAPVTLKLQLTKDLQLIQNL